MNKTLILSLVLLVSCGKHHKDPRTNHNTDAVFRSYINVFESNYGKHIGDIPIYFADAKDDITAQCLKWITGERAIEVDQVEWNSLSKEQRQQLIDHELGHCELNLDHNDNYERDSTGYYLCPSSIMNPNVFSDYSIENCFVPNHAYYMGELFKR